MTGVQTCALPISLQNSRSLRDGSVCFSHGGVPDDSRELVSIGIEGTSLIAAESIDAVVYTPGVVKESSIMDNLLSS